MGEWRRLSLRRAGVQLIDCDHRTPASVEDGYPYVAIPQLSEGRIDLTSARKITREDFISWTKKAKPQANDVVLSRRTNPGVTAYVPEGVEFALGQNLVLLRADGREIFPPFLRWLVQGPEWWEQIGKFLNVGAVFDSLKCVDVPNFELTLPPLGEQRAIADFLGAVDDKIELNRRTNETLEAMARALFKSWSVHFDPVRAKSKNLQQKLPKKISELFPDEFQDTELGVIPQGWNSTNLLEVVDVIGGGTPKTSAENYWDGDIPWFSVVDAPATTDVWVLDTEKKITKEGLENSAANILTRGTTILSARGTVGRVALVGAPMAMNQSCYGLRAKVGEGFFSYFLIRKLIEQLKQRAHGSVFDTITRDTLSGMTVVSPPENIIEEFENHVRPNLESILNRLKETHTLSQLRDSVLPKLISGELRIHPQGSGR